MRFFNVDPNKENCWRSVVLFGRNVQSYKFALAKALLDLAPRQKELITLDELAVPFSRHLAEHLAHTPKQGTSPRSQFLDGCRDFNAGKINKEQLVAHTVRLGFNNVIDAFHVVGPSEVPVRFFHDDRKAAGGIRLTDDFFELSSLPMAKDLPAEVEARWRLVETAWSLKVSRRMLSVEYDPVEELLFSQVPEHDRIRRVNVTSCRDALNGYQKGFCFYCFAPISVVAGDDALAEVDHFLPWVLQQRGVLRGLDGVWNLVLACVQCNRGNQGGKFARIPDASLLTQLHHRNEYLINSHHPLRETLISQTGKTTSDRAGFLQDRHKGAQMAMPQGDWWKPTPRNHVIL